MIDTVISTDEFDRIAAILHKESGIRIPQSKAAMVFARLSKRVRALGLENLHDYCNLVSDSSGVSERKNMVYALTTNVTKFFREPHHFDHFGAHFASELAPRLRKGNAIRIWSAGCSTGQEPFSIAAVALANMADAWRYDFKILATDLDENVLNVGRAGRYRTNEIDTLAPEHRPFFSPSGDGFVTCSDELRRLVTFKTLNLVDKWPMRVSFDAVFCRNVVIYFDETTQTNLWPRFAGQLCANGFLYIGHSERVSGSARALFDPVGVTIYQLKRHRIA